MSEIPRYRVTGVQQTMRSTYTCPTPEWALKKLRQFVDNEYAEVACVGPDGAAVTEADLVALVEGVPAGGAPIDIEAAKSLTLVALA